MSVEQTDVVDILGTDRETGHVVLTISDHLDWSDSVDHQTILQKKLNKYLAFVESGEILEQYPDAKNRPVAFRVVFQVPPDESGQAFIARARAAIESAGFTLRDEVFTGGRFNCAAHDALEHWPLINADSDFVTPLVPNPVFRAIVPAWSRSVYRSGGSRVWSGLW